MSWGENETELCVDFSPEMRIQKFLKIRFEWADIIYDMSKAIDTYNGP